jgi:hypothetical protein
MNLYIYGAIIAPIDLNDRIRPPTTALDERFLMDPVLEYDRVLSQRLLEVTVTIDEATFMSPTGPGRFANTARLEFVNWFFLASSEQVNVGGATVYRFVTPNGTAIDVPSNLDGSMAEFSMSAANLVAAGVPRQMFEQNIAHSLLPDDAEVANRSCDLRTSK